MTFRAPYSAGSADLVDGARSWRVWHLMGTADLRRRHSRSKFGQFWIALSTGVTIFALGLVWSLLWQMPVAGIMPYITVAMIFWGFISGALMESTAALTSVGNLFLNQKTSFSVAIYTLIYRNLITAGYNFVIILVVFVAFQVSLTWNLFLLLPGLLLTILFLIPTCYALAIVTTRFRDAAPLVQSITQIGYFITPVLWQPQFIPQNYQWINVVNPFAVFLALLRDPMLGVETSTAGWLAALGYTAAVWIVGLPFIGAYHKRAIYWI
jgi:ABC-type polysaccharide/polyol phosphate export permease